MISIKAAVSFEMASRTKKPKPVKPRIPLPLKPPKREPKSNAYMRPEKHKLDWEMNKENDAAISDEDK
jgi:hypothetical protein